MNSRQRTANAMYGKTVDRPPCVPLIDLSYAAAAAGMDVSQCFLNPAKHAEALVEVFRRHPEIDGLSVNISLDDSIVLGHSTEKDRHIVQTTGGLTWQVPFNDVGSVKETEIKTFDDPRIDEDDPFSPGIINTLRAIPANMRSNNFINAGVTGAFSQVAFLMGLETVMLASLDDPSGLLGAIERRLPFALRWIETMAELDPAAIWIGEGVASASLISPDTYRKFVLPFEQVLFDRLRQLKIPGILHICGRLGGILDIIPESRCDCLELDWQVDMAEAAKRIGDQVTLKGNLNTSVLVQADPREIRTLSRATIEKASQAEGFILSSGCCLGRDTPPDNVDAMARAAAEYREN
jgi:uroporphyrinogen decarboxylase